MPIGRVIRIDETPGGGVRLTVREWPLAPPFAAVTGAAALPLLVWAVAGGHWVEAAGAAVFVALAATAAGLAASGRRTVEFRGGQMVADEGAGPWRREVRHPLGAEAVVEVEALEGPSGAPSPGADLVIRAGALRYRLARAVGPRAAELDGARDELAVRLAAGSPSTGPVPPLG